MEPKTAIVTGAAGTIGRAICESLAGKGWRVAALDLDADGLARVEGGVLPITCDVTDEAAVAEAFAKAGSEFGTPGIDLLVSNAGIAHPVTGPIEELSLAGWRRMTDSHLLGAFLTVRAAVPGLRARGGSIVTMSSVRAVQAEPDCEGYGAAKGGLIGLTQSLAVSLGPEVRANTILPGWIVPPKERPDLREVDHGQHPAGRAGRPEDIAEAVIYLEGAGFVTGQTLVVDGGMGRKMVYAE
ncbi:SDR family oxidoreductase [Roseicyclus sp. F158]|uniref:SDR family oxidoreductase n=1 Tax=Tropicimonas omnivorans TaxID=3075590 RepID=A0ABU3DDL7_9RHOB|nr:SDR family oxidoreductase [Roseicyclus sp. F158]MDT0681782.1 SDR family oxidoreductase [Roseicyclus sp. F158]